MSDYGDIDDDGWQAPTEGELKIIKARQERQDKISKIMGQYLLKGYKMLATTCPECSTILMKTRPANGTTADGEEYCIACNELDSDISKDDPVLDLTAARSQVLEGQQSRPLSHSCSREVAVGLESGRSSVQMVTGGRMASFDGSELSSSPPLAQTTEARPSHPDGAVSGNMSSGMMRMGRPDTGSTQIESCTALGSLRKCDPPRVSSDETGSRARCAMLTICPTIKPKDPTSSQSSDVCNNQPAGSAAPPSFAPSFGAPHQPDYCPVHQHCYHPPQSHCHHHHGHWSDSGKIKESLAVVLEKMDWASNLLKKSTDVEQSKELCSLIASCAEAVAALTSACAPERLDDKP